MSTRRAAIDVGTNSVKLLAADVDAGAISNVVFDDQTTTGLGEGLSSTGRLDPLAIERTAGQVARYALVAREGGAAEIRVGGTAAVRNTISTNAHELIDLVQAGSGLDLRVLSGEEELKLAREATLSEFGGCSPLVVVDIGGGSTELTVVNNGEIVEQASFDTGARSLTDVFTEIRPFRPKNMIGYEAALWDRFRGAGESAQWDAIRADHNALLIVQGGTAYCAARLAPGSSPAELHGRAVSLVWLAELALEVRQLNSDGLRSLLSFDPDRSPVLFAGLMLINFFGNLTRSLSFTFSEYSLRHGMVLAEHW